MRKTVWFLLCCAMASALAACADVVAKMAGDALIDAGQALKGSAHRVSNAFAQPMLDASAQQPPSDASSKATCDPCSGTAAKTASRIITADTDTNQLVGELVTFDSADAWKELASGPLVVTDFVSPDGWSLHLALADPSQCGTTREALAMINPTAGVPAVHGARLLVPKGKVLCGSAYNSGSNGRWAGFRPYE